MENNIVRRDKWRILEDYLKMEMSLKEIADKHLVEYKWLETFISQTWKDFQNARESRMLIATQGSTNLFDKMSKEYLDSNRITEEFKELLSGDEDPLSDHELLFANLLVETGDEVASIEQSKLDKGLKSTAKSSTSSALREAKRLRAIYLKKKPNVAEYIYQLESLNSKVLDNSKVFLMETLVEQIRYQKARNNPRESSSLSKNLELLAKITGDLSSKTQLEVVSGDDGLERIFAKAAEAKALTEQ